jgi:cobalt-zinc-cadmium efflux system outer membrane protein
VAASLLFAIALGACAHAPPVASKPEHDEHEGPAPHLRSAASAAAHPPHSVGAEPSKTGEISLDTILAFADQHSPVLRVARSTRSRADAARAAAPLVLPANPELTVAVGPRFAGGDTGVDVEASLTQRIEVGGQRGLRVEAADRLHELTDAEIEQIRWVVHCDVHAMFHKAVVERERALLAKQVVAFQEEVLRVVERQIAAGETAPLTLRLAQAEVAQAKQLLALSEQALTASRMRLGQLAGWPAANPPDPIGGVDAPREPPAYAELIKVAREKLPSLRAGSAAIAEARARAALADREGWVQPSIGAQYNRESSPAGGDANHVLMGILSLPIPGFRANEGERAKARADIVVANAELSANKEMLDAEIAVARSEVVAAAQRTRAYGTEILPRFEENLTLLRRAFELGEIDILALSVGRERFLRIQSDAFGAQLDYFVALAALERVVGVDLWQDQHHEGAAP